VPLLHSDWGTVPEARANETADPLPMDPATRSPVQVDPVETPIQGLRCGSWLVVAVLSWLENG
jgi:hypothetical protein